MQPFLLDVDILDVVDTFKVCLQKDPFFNNFLIDFLLIRQDGCSDFKMVVLFYQMMMPAHGFVWSKGLVLR